MSDTPRILVLGIGNPLMLDEGVGVRVVEELDRLYQLPSSVNVVDAGTMGLGMMPLFKGIDAMIIVDAVEGTGYAPGTVVRLSPDDFAPNQILHSLHDVKFVDVLQSCALVGIEPEAECIGIQVESISPVDLTIGLSEPVQAALPRALAAVLTLLAERGIAATARPTDDPDRAAFLAEVDRALGEMREGRREG
ncbi:MAG: HyaD/HybD family hydrogenase maturation endopeptidase [Coriobacteriia bacterium]